MDPLTVKNTRPRLQDFTAEPIARTHFAFGNLGSPDEVLVACPARLGSRNNKRQAGETGPTAVPVSEMCACVLPFPRRHGAIGRRGRTARRNVLACLRTHGQTPCTLPGDKVSPQFLSERKSAAAGSVHLPRTLETGASPPFTWLVFKGSLVLGGACDRVPTVCGTPTLF